MVFDGTRHGSSETTPRGAGLHHMIDWDDVRYFLAVPRGSMHGETRKTKRVRLFTEFVSRRLAAYAPLLAGLSSARD
jgi:hypothetical protein